MSATINDVPALERKIEKMEAERARRLENLEGQEWTDANRVYNEVLERNRAKLAGMRAEVQAAKERGDAATKADADKAESLAKRQARGGFAGTDAEFEAAWPEIWAAIRNRQAAGMVERPRSQVHI